MHILQTIGASLRPPYCFCLPCYCSVQVHRGCESSGMKSNSSRHELHGGIRNTDQQRLNLLSHSFYACMYRDLKLLEPQERSIAEAISHDIFVACSDGSYDPLALSTTYGIACGTMHSPILRSQGPCPSHPSQQSALCSELCSINAAVKIFLYIYSKFGVEKGSVTLYNDCKKAHKLLLYPGRKFRHFL
jgi:hypothetical protein